MADQQGTSQPAAPAAAADDSEDQQDGSGGSWGRVMDTAGILAGIVLVAIVIDIFSDGRLISRRLQPRRDPDPAAEQDPQDQPS